MALKKGQAMIEFYSMLPILKKWHDDDGYRSAKSLYDKAINESKITMKYEQFNTYFKKEIAPKKEVFVATKVTQSLEEITPTDQANIEEKRIPKFGDEDWEPPIVTIGSEKSKPYNPHKNGPPRKIL